MFAAPTIRYCLGLALIAFTLLLCAYTSPLRTATVTVLNNSDWDIDHLYLSPIDATNWGKDLIGGTEDDYLSKGEKFTITNLECKLYDVRLVDDEARECVLEDVTLCTQTLQWEVTNHLLANCDHAR